MTRRVACGSRRGDAAIAALAAKNRSPLSHSTAMSLEIVVNARPRIRALPTHKTSAARELLGEVLRAIRFRVRPEGGDNAIQIR